MVEKLPGNPKNPPSQETASTFGVVLPCEPDDFSKFISSLLGKPQTIEKILLGTFSISNNDIINIAALIDQRIKQQNEASLIQTTVRILYDDNSSVLLNSIEEFVSYSEIKPLISIGAVLSFTYLIKFKDKSYPEKQQIDISFMSNGGDSGIVNIEDGVHVIKRFNRFSGSLISFRISHTARSWGSDIESLLTGHIKELFSSEHWLKRFIWKHSESIGLVSGLVLFAAMLIGANLAAYKFMTTQVENVKHILNINPTNTEMLSAKVNFLINLIAEGAWSRFMIGFSVYFVIAIIISIVAGIMIENFADNAPNCFVILSRKSEDRKKELLKRRERKWILLVGSIIFNIIIGVVSNIIFSICFEKSFKTVVQLNNSQRDNSSADR